MLTWSPKNARKASCLNRLILTKRIRKDDNQTRLLTNEREKGINAPRGDTRKSVTGGEGEGNGPDSWKRMLVDWCTPDLEKKRLRRKSKKEAQKTFGREIDEPRD